jgi:hypothetical protein
MVILLLDIDSLFYFPILRRVFLVGALALDLLPCAAREAVFTHTRAPQELRESRLAMR